MCPVPKQGVFDVGEKVGILGVISLIMNKARCFASDRPPIL